MRTLHAPTLEDILEDWLKFLPETGHRCDPIECYSGEEDRQLEHVRYVVGEIRTFLAAGRFDKVMRWFCWAQGVLWSLGYLTLDDCRVDVYRVLNEGREPEVEA